MQPGQRVDRVHNLSRKQPYQRRYDPHELCVALAEVARAVELVEKKVRRRAITLRVEQIGIGELEALLLIELDRWLDFADAPI